MSAKIVFVATRDPSYSRVATMLAALQTNYEVRLIGSLRKNYLARLITIIAKLCFAWLRGEFRDAKLVVVGFLAQPAIPFVRIFWRGPIVADAFVSLYDTLVFDKCKVEANSIVAKLCYYLDRNLLDQSQLCLTDTAAHADYFQRTFGSSTRVERVWVSAPERRLTQDERATTLDYELQATTPFQVFFWGNYIPLQGVPTIIEAAALLRDENIQFTLTGRGQTYGTCREQHQQLGGDNIRFHAWMQPNEIRSHAAKSHLTLGIFGTSAKSSRVIPNKVFQSLALGMPVVTRESPAIDELLVSGHDVLVVPPADARALADKIRWVRENYAEAVRIGQRGHATFARIASPKHVAESLKQQIDELLSLHETSNGAFKSASNSSRSSADASRKQSTTLVR